MLTRKEAESCCAMLRRIVYREAAPLSLPGRERMRSLLEAHEMASMVDCADDPALRPVQDRKNALMTAVYAHSLRETVYRLFREMEKRGIVCALLKGEAINSCYPPEVVRTSCDIDLYLPGKQREAFAAMMRDLGFRLGEDLFTGQLGVDDYWSEDGIHLEVHSVYFQRIGARQRKLLKERGFFSDALFERADGYVTLKPEAHLVYLIYHAAKHVVGHSVTLRMLMDLTQFVNRHAGSIDGEAFAALTRELGLTRIANAIFCFCEAHLGLRQGFWRKTGPRMDLPLRMMMMPTDEERTRLSWEQLFMRPYQSFYTETCEETDTEYRLRHTFRKRRLLLSRTFVFWWLVRLVWGFEVDFSGEAV